MALLTAITTFIKLSPVEAHLEPMMSLKIPVDQSRLTDLCQRWQIQELAAFGSAVRGGMRPDSDVDLLVSYLPSAKLSLLDEVRLADELSELFGRPVDLVDRQSVETSENWIRRRSILSAAVTVFSAS